MVWIWFVILYIFITQSVDLKLIYVL